MKSIKTIAEAYYEMKTESRRGKMPITRRSQLTRKNNTMMLDVTADQIADWESGTPVQRAFPNLSAGEREFIKTGITPEEWENAFGKLEESESHDKPVKFHGRTFTDYEVFDSERKANNFLVSNPEYGVIGERDGKVYVVKMDDMGIAESISPTESQLNRLKFDLEKIAKESLELSVDHGKLYAMGSELACLRLFYHYRNAFKAGKDIKVSRSSRNWFFVMELSI